MLKRRAVTIAITVLLVLSAILIDHFYVYTGVTYRGRSLIYIMLIATAHYVFLGCMLQTFNLHKYSAILGFATFLILCTCLFYSTEFLQFIVCLLCMAILIKRGANHCNCISEEDNIFA